MTIFSLTRSLERGRVRQLAVRLYCSTRAWTISRIFRCCFSRELGDFLEGALDLADGTFASGDGLSGGGDEEVLDADAEGLGHFGEKVGARRHVAPLPEGDVGLGDLEEPGELDLGEAGCLAEGEQASALLGPWSLGRFGFTRHEGTARAGSWPSYWTFWARRFFSRQVSMMRSLIEYVTDGKHRRVGKKVDGVLVKQWGGEAYRRAQESACARVCR